MWLRSSSVILENSNTHWVDHKTTPGESYLHPRLFFEDVKSTLGSNFGCYSPFSIESKYLFCNKLTRTILLLSYSVSFVTPVLPRIFVDGSVKLIGYSDKDNNKQ